MAHPFFNPAQAAAFNALTLKTESIFENRYFHSTAKQAWPAPSSLTNVHEGDWPEYKPTTPVGAMPLLTATSSDGKTKLQIAESDSIERYLARKFGLFGNGIAFKEVLVNTFANNTQALIMEIFNKFALIEDAEVKAANKGSLYHEEHLQAKGANGHYVGDKVTLADVKTDHVISMILGVSGEELVSESKTPAIWRVREEMNTVEGIAVWKASEEYKALEKENFEFLAY
ncbi:Glutathione S-transferase S1 [Mortierella sp. AD032]|nr:Glutathione S-transferase S1 [Mortierella sp. AD032]